MEYCTECGAEIQEGSKFCGACGAKVDQAVTDTGQEAHMLEAEPTKEKPKKEKKVKDKHKGDTKQKFSMDPATFLMLGLLFIHVLPGVVESLMMLSLKHALSGLTVLVSEVIGMLVGFYLLCLYLKTLNKASQHKSDLNTAGAGILLIFAIILAAIRLTELIPSVIIRYDIEPYWIYYVVYGVIVYVSLVAISTTLYNTLSKLMGVEGKKLLKQPKLFWQTFLLLGLALFVVPDLLVMLFSGELFTLPLSFVGTVTQWVLLVALQGSLLKKAVDSILKTYSDSQESLPYHSRSITAIAVLFIIGLLAFDVISASMFSTVDAIEASIQSDMNQAAFYMAAGDIEMAMYLYDEAYDKTTAWIAFVRDTPEAINQLRTLYKENPDNEEIEYLLALKTYSVQDLEYAIYENKDTSRWYNALLNAYDQMENDPDNPVVLTEQQEKLRTEILNSCIAGQALVNSAIGLEDIEGKEDKVVQALEPYQAFIEAYDGYKILNMISTNGGINSDIMNRLLTYAEENPENLLAQYMAFETGSQFLYDRAPHYARTAEAAIRFRQLYVNQLTDNKDQATIAVDMEVADALMGLLDYQDAVVYLEEAYELGADSSTMLLAAHCYEALENYEKSLEMASVAVASDPENQVALNIAMISALKIGNITESLAYAADLLALLPSLEGDQFLQADADLYIYVQYLTIWDQTQWTPQMKYKVYPDLSEEQLQLLSEHPLLDHYIKAVFFTFTRKDFEEAWLHTEALLTAYPNSAQIQYLAGTIHFDKREFEEAISYYESSLAIDDSAPTLWFALANAYDGLEMYQEAYNCTLKVAELLQYSNHAVDIYGVQYHNNALMYQLGHRLEEEGN